MTVIGAGFHSNEGVTIDFPKLPARATKANSKGSFSLQFQVPHNVEAGKHNFVARANTTRLVAPFVVRAKSS